EFLKSGKYTDMFSKMLNDNPLLFYDLTKISSDLSISIPSISNIIENIHELGYDAGRTTFSWTGIKSNISYSGIISIIQKYRDQLKS
ncbi:MAG: hypothetical protein ACP5UV_04025, partial [Thermoplasmata archaeon]